MTETSMTFYLDRAIDMDTLATGVARILDVHRARIATLDASDEQAFSTPWFADTDLAAVQVSRLRGDFPLEVTVTVRREVDVEHVTRALSSILKVAIITDEFGVDQSSDIQWVLIAPDGTLARVLTDSDAFGDEDPALVLQPRYRKLYETTMSHVAAD